MALHRIVLLWLVDVGEKEGGDTGAREGETQPAAKGEARGGRWPGGRRVDRGALMNQFKCMR